MDLGNPILVREEENHYKIFPGIEGYFGMHESSIAQNSDNCKKTK